MKLTAVQIEKPFCLFLVGMQCRSWRSLWRMPFIASRMAAMQKELIADPATGFLWGKGFASARPLTTLFLSYWQSSEDIERFVKSPRYSHLASVGEYYKKFKDHPDIGVWHETYEVFPEHAEAMYFGMNPLGMSGFMPIIPIAKNTQQFKQRLRGTT
jgi:hypothetical protein